MSLFKQSLSSVALQGISKELQKAGISDKDLDKCLDEIKRYYRAICTEKHIDALVMPAGLGDRYQTLIKKEHDRVVVELRQYHLEQLSRALTTVGFLVAEKQQGRHLLNV